MSSYGDPTSADLYFAALPNTSAWDALDDTQKQKYLNRGTLIIDQFGYIGFKNSVEPDLANEWPRSGIVNQDKDTIPDNIYYANYEIAHALARGIDPDKAISGTNVTSRGFSSVRTTYDAARTPEYVLNGVPSATAWNYLLPYFLRGSTGVIRLHRVN